jgi:ABC-2 type transport system ATP-binding protein
MREVCFMTDIAVLPRWMRVTQLLDYFAGVHPAFDREKAEALLARSYVGMRAKVGALSKGMVTQLHLAIVMAVRARLLVLDEPTLGLDLVSRKQFYDTLLNDYFDDHRTIVITTHQVEEIEHVLTDVVFIDRGQAIFSASMEEIESRYLEVAVNADQIEVARRLQPVHERQALGWTVLLFDGVERTKLEALGDVRTPRISDLFEAMLGCATARAKGAAQ